MKLFMAFVVAATLAVPAYAYSSTRCTTIGSTVRCTTTGSGTISTTRCTTIGSTVRCTTF